MNGIYCVIAEARGSVKRYSIHSPVFLGGLEECHKTLDAIVAGQPTVEIRQ